MYLITENPNKFQGLKEWLDHTALKTGGKMADPLASRGQ